MVFVLKVSGELPQELADLPSVALDLAVFTNRSYLTAEAGPWGHGWASLVQAFSVAVELFVPD